MLGFDLLLSLSFSFLFSLSLSLSIFIIVVVIIIPSLFHVALLLVVAGLLRWLDYSPCIIVGKFWWVDAGTRIGGKANPLRWEDQRRKEKVERRMEKDFVLS